MNKSLAISGIVFYSQYPIRSNVNWHIILEIHQFTKIYIFNQLTIIKYHEKNSSNCNYHSL